eukprot:736850-Pyramimonas_sp.AAC.3
MKSAFIPLKGNFANRTRSRIAKSEKLFATLGNASTNASRVRQDTPYRPTYMLRVRLGGPTGPLLKSTLKTLSSICTPCINLCTCDPGRNY